MSSPAGKGATPTSLLRRFGNYWQLRKLRRPQPRRGVVVTTCQNEAIARVIVGRPADQGINAFVFQEEAGSGALPVPAPVHVIVRPEDESAASELLA